MARWIATVSALLLVAGCASYNVKTQTAPGVDFSKYKTFGQKPPPKSVANIPGYSTIMGEHIQAAIAQEMESKGFRSASSGAPDLMVVITITGQPRQDVDYAGGAGWYGGGAYTVNYVQGTLIIDIFDAEQSKLIWHSYGQTDLYGSQSAKSSEKNVDAAVKAILKDFPPGSSKK